VRASWLVACGGDPDAQPDAARARVSRQGGDRGVRRRAGAFAARPSQGRRHPGRGAHARDRGTDRKLFSPRHRGAGGLPARHALRRPARGAAARALPPELRLLAPHRGARPCRRRQLLRPVRRAPHLRPDPARLARDAAAQDGRDLLVLPLPRHVFRPHLPARGEGPAAGLGHAAAQVAGARRGGAAGVLAAGSARSPARVLLPLMEWWLWPIALFAITFAMGIVAVLAGVGGGVLFVPIVSAFFPFHLDFVRAAGLLIALTSALSAAPSLLVNGLAGLRLAMPLALVGSVTSVIGALLGLALPTGIVQIALGVTILGIALIMWRAGRAEHPDVARPDALGVALGMHGVYHDPALAREVSWQVHRTPAAFFAFAGIGVLAGMFGLGAGWANVPALNLL